MPATMRRRQPPPTPDEIMTLRHADWAVKYARGRGLTLATIAAMYGVTESTVSRGVARVEATRGAVLDALAEFGPVPG